MSVLSLEMGWALVAATIMLFILALGVIATVLLHSRKIREAENRFRCLFEKVFDAVILVDENTIIVDANEATGRLLGYSKKHLLSSPLEKFLPPDRWPALFMELTKCLKSRIDYLGDIEFFHSAGRIVSVEAGITCLEIKGRVHLLASFRDISMTRQARDELERKNAVLKDVLAHMEEEKMKYRREVAQTVDKVIMPELQGVLDHDDQISKAHYDSLKGNLQELAESAGGMLHTYGKLTPREVEICNMLKNGATSKNIADTLKISLQTVKKHRERIRRKLVISNREINLSTYLKKQNN